MSAPETSSENHRGEHHAASVSDRRPDVERAAAALRRGQLVVLPTETVYGIFASATNRAAVDLLLGLTGIPSQPAAPLAWHSHDAAAVRDLLNPIHPVHRRLLRRLMPGPVTWVIEGSPQTTATIRTSLGPVDGAIISGDACVVRVPDHPLAGEVLSAVGAPVIARSIAAAGWGSGAALPANLKAAPPEPVSVVIDQGPTRFGRHSTTIRLLPGGGFAAEPGGALEDRFIRKQLERTILFICTGNTCRSPMAAAIARKLLDDAPPDGITNRVKSAGTFASGGQPATPESVEALRKQGIEMGRHSSTELDRRAIAEADVVYTMTREHAEAVLSLDPGAAAKVKTLDPSGRAIPDPIGGPQEVYDRAASHIRDLLSMRLKELEP